MVRWARANWDNTKVHIFDVNCANFVSNALAQAGLPYKMDPIIGTWASDSWGRGPQTGWDWLDTRNGSHTDSWSQARAQRDFFLSNGGAAIPIAEARPGDIIYWTHTGPTGPAHVYHASVVTAVTPDGDVRYPQHTPGGAQDCGLATQPLIG
jgi:Putative amidase domain